MPEVQEVYRMATQKVRPDPGAMERQRQKQRFHTGKQKAALFALAAGLLVGAVLVGISLFRDTEERPATPAPGQDHDTGAIEGLPVSEEALTGIWLEDGGTGLLWEFTADGRITIGEDGLLDTDPWGRGTYEVEDGIITQAFQNSPQEGGEFCVRADAFLPEDGRLLIVALGDPGSPCQAFAGQERSFVRVSPISLPAQQITADVPPGGWGTLPVGTGSLLRGIWLLVGEGHLLRLGTDGTYALDGDGTLATDPDDVGTFEVDSDAGTITLTSGADSRGCSEGERAVWVEAQFGGNALRGDLGSADCAAHEGLGGTWVRISS
jgi:hypothetical protein